MSSVLCIEEKNRMPFHFAQPYKDIFAKKFFEGSTGEGGIIIIEPTVENITFFETVDMIFRNAMSDEPYDKKFSKVVKLLNQGKSLEIWFEN